MHRNMKKKCEPKFSNPSPKALKWIFPALREKTQLVGYDNVRNILDGCSA
jgi:hypothetical protein